MLRFGSILVVFSSPGGAGVEGGLRWGGGQDLGDPRGRSRGRPGRAHRPGSGLHASPRGTGVPPPPRVPISHGDWAAGSRALTEGAATAEKEAGSRSVRAVTCCLLFLVFPSHAELSPVFKRLIEAEP